MWCNLCPSRKVVNWALTKCWQRHRKAGQEGQMGISSSPSLLSYLSVMWFLRLWFQVPLVTQVIVPPTFYQWQSWLQWHHLLLCPCKTLTGLLAAPCSPLNLPLYSFQIPRPSHYPSGLAVQTMLNKWHHCSTMSEESVAWLRSPPPFLLQRFCPIK